MFYPDPFWFLLVLLDPLAIGIMVCPAGFLEKEPMSPDNIAYGGLRNVLNPSLRYSSKRGLIFSPVSDEADDLRMDMGSSRRLGGAMGYQVFNAPTIFSKSFRHLLISFQSTPKASLTASSPYLS